MLFWMRLGTTVAMVAVGYIVLVEGFQDTRVYRDHSFPVALSLIMAGVVLGGIGYRAARRSAHTVDPEDLGEYQGVYKYLANGRQQIGLTAFCLGLAAIALVPATYEDQLVKAKEASPPKPTHAPVVIETNEPPVEKPIPPWPEKPLKIEGLNLDPKRPSIIVDQKTYEIGEMLQGAKILKIAREHIVVEYYGQRQTNDMPDF